MTQISNDENPTALDGVVELQTQAVTERIKDFSDLLTRIETLDDKKKRLWVEIYENAITDRQNAFAVFLDLLRLSKGRSTELAVHARNISGFVERMTKANDQLIRLAELIERAEHSNDSIDPDDVFNKINKERKR